MYTCSCPAHSLTQAHTNTLNCTDPDSLSSNNLNHWQLCTKTFALTDRNSRFGQQKVMQWFWFWLPVWLFRNAFQRRSSVFERTSLFETPTMIPKPAVTAGGVPPAVIPTAADPLEEGRPPLPKASPPPPRLQTGLVYGFADVTRKVKVIDDWDFEEYFFDFPEKVIRTCKERGHACEINMSQEAPIPVRVFLKSFEWMCTEECKCMFECMSASLYHPHALGLIWFGRYPCFATSWATPNSVR
jgi:hypothetical protein